MVLSGFDSGKLIAFNPENGSLIWEARMALPKGRTDLERMVDIDGSPLLQGDVIYAVTYQGRSAHSPAEPAEVSGSRTATPSRHRPTVWVRSLSPSLTVRFALFAPAVARSYGAMKTSFYVV